MSRSGAGFGQRSKATVVELGDDFRRRTSLDALKLAGIDPASPLEGSDVAGFLAAIDSAEPEAAKERALRLLGFRERSTHELSERLLGDGYPAQVVKKTVDRLHELSLVNDSRFAELFIRTKLASGWGRRRITIALQEHHLEEPVLLEALEQECPESQEVDRAASQLRGRSLVTHKDRQWAIKRLVRRGFTFSVARQAVDMAAQAASEIDSGSGY